LTRRVEFWQRGTFRSAGDLVAGCFLASKTPPVQIAKNLVDATSKVCRTILVEKTDRLAQGRCRGMRAKEGYIDGQTSPAASYAASKKLGRN
jgi:hypothetical protein